MAIVVQQYRVIFADVPRWELEKEFVQPKDTVIFANAPRWNLTKDIVLHNNVVLWGVTERDERPITHVLSPARIVLDQLRTDRHLIGGTVEAEGVPAKRAVFAFDRRTMKYVGGTYSNEDTGEWQIKGTLEYPERSLLVIAIDSSNTYNAEVADFITQVAPNPPPGPPAPEV
jgi:hypothetical protein